MQTFATGVLPFMVILGAVTVLMLLEPHLSGTLLILGIGAVLMFVGGTGLKWFALAGIAGAGAIAAAVVLLPEEVRVKFRGTLTRIVNEGATGLICLIL